MGKKKPATGPGPKSGAAQNQAKDRHFRDGRDKLDRALAPLPVPLVAKKPRFGSSSKYPTYFELVENSDKKKKLEIQDTEDLNPQPGFSFVRSGDPIMTEKCKEISRERGFLMFRVLDNSCVRDLQLKKSDLSRHMSRVGYHVRECVFEEALQSVGSGVPLRKGAAGAPEPIPEKQAEINAQADAAIRDLFPRIPHTDRQQIIDRAFRKARGHHRGREPVGLATDLPLTRRVQLAVLAHIRHDLTQYDACLRMGVSRLDARRHVQPVCLDYLVKWRGDEETGRDQLDEILREVIVIDDEEDSDESSDDSAEPSVGDTSPPGSSGRGDRQISRRAPVRVPRHEGYEAARDQAWQQAVDRHRGQPDRPVHSMPSRADVTNSYQPVTLLPWPPPRPTFPGHSSNGYRDPSPDAIGPDRYHHHRHAESQQFYDSRESYQPQASYAAQASHAPQAYYPPEPYYPLQASRQPQQPPRLLAIPPRIPREIIDLTGDEPFAPPAHVAMIPVQNKFPKRFESPPPAEQYRVRPVHGIPRATEQTSSGSRPASEQFHPERITRQERVLGVIEGPAPQRDRSHERILGLASPYPGHAGGEQYPVHPAPFRQERVLGYGYSYADLPR